MDSKKAFDDAIGELAPSTVDLDDVVRRGRRAVALRRVLTPLTGLATAAVLVAVAVTIPSGGQPEHGVAATSPTVSSPSPNSVVVNPHTYTRAACAESPSRARQRLTAATRELVQERLTSGERLTSSRAAHDGRTAYGPLEFFWMATPDATGSPCAPDSYFAHANAAIHDLMGSITVTVSRSALPIQPCPTPPDIGLVACVESRGPHGEQILALTQNEGRYFRHVVWVNKDGTSVEVTAANRTVPETVGGPDELPLTPLSPSQLVEIALDSRLVLR